MRFKLTILLLVLNIALLSYIFYFNKVQSTRTLFDESSRLILEPDFLQGLDEVQFSSSHLDTPWVLKKQDKKWMVDSPYQWKANPFAVEQLLFQLRRLSWESRFTVSDVRSSGRSLESYNLESPPIRITLASGDISLSLALGAPTEIGNRLYLMSPDGEYIYVVNRSILDILQKDLEAFLDRRAFGMAARGIRGIQIQDWARSNVRVRLERQEDQWNFVSPISTQADPRKVEAFVQLWQNVEIEEFAAGSDAAMESLNGEAIKLTFEGMGQRETLLFNPNPDEDSPGTYLAKHEDYPAVFRIQTEIVERLRTAQEDLRERKVMSHFSHNWTTMEINFGPNSVRLQQLESGDWQVLHTDESGQLKSAPADLEAIEELQNLLQTLEAERFVTDAPSEADLGRFGFNEPQRKVTLRMPAGSIVEFEIGELFPDPDMTLLYARTNQSSSVFLIRPHVLNLLSLDPLRYRLKTIRSLPESAIVEGMQFIDQATGENVLENEIEEEALISLQNDLDTFLRVTRVERFHKAPFSDPLPLNTEESIPWPYLLQAQITYPNNPTQEAETISLFISDRIGGSSQFVGDPVSGMVGTLPMHLVEQLDPIITTEPAEPELELEPEPVN